MKFSLRKIVLVSLVFLVFMASANAEQTLLSVSFSDKTPKSSWFLSHFRGEASMTTQIVHENNQSVMKLGVNGNGGVCDSWHFPFSGLQSGEKQVKVSFRYKADGDIPLFISISAAAGCMPPWIKSKPTLITDQKWHEGSLFFDTTGFGREQAILEFIFEGGIESHSSLLVDWIKVELLDGPAIMVKWFSPGSKVLFDKVPHQQIILDLVNRTAKTGTFAVTVQHEKNTNPFLKQDYSIEGEEKIYLDSTDWPLGEFHIDVSFNDQSMGKWTVRKYPYRKNAVLIYDGVPHINGKPELILGLYHTSDAAINIINKENASGVSNTHIDRETLLAEVTDRGFNTIHFSWDVAPADYYQAAAKHELWVISESRDRFEKVNLVKDQSSTLGWYGIDEPVLSMKEQCAALYQKYKEMDPYHPMMTAFCHGGLGYGETRLVDIAMPDPYRTVSSDANFNDVVKFHVGTCREALLRKDPTTCVIYVPQLFSMDSVMNGYIPTYAQIRSEVYTAWYYGAKGFVYYAWYTHETLSKGMSLNPKRKHWFLPESPLWNQIGKLNAELTDLKEILLFGQDDKQITFAHQGSALCKTVVLPDRRQYIFLINPTSEPQNNIHILGLESGEKLMASDDSILPQRVDSKKYLLANLPAYGISVYGIKR